MRKTMFLSWMIFYFCSLRPNSSSELRNGVSAFFWWDPWIPFSPLKDFLASDNSSSVWVSLSSTSSDFHSFPLPQTISYYGWSNPHVDSRVKLAVFQAWQIAIYIYDLLDCSTYVLYNLELISSFFY